MHTPFAERSQFEAKAALLSEALGCDTAQAQQLLAHLAGYDNPAAVEYGDRDKRTWSSREELVARLLAIRPDLANDRAASLVDSLALPARDGDIEHVRSSPDAVPNISG